MSSDPNCIFCKIIRKEIPATVVDEDEHCLAFRDLNPQAPVHVLVIPKEHVANVSDASATHSGALMVKGSEIAKKEGLSNGFRLVVNTGDDGGQTVHHLHLHVLGGRQMQWPPG